MAQAKIILSLLLIAAITLVGCTTEISESEEIFKVGSEKMDCTGGNGPQKCLYVNEHMFYEHIENFEFEEGYGYELKVKKSLAYNTTNFEKIPADASMYKYELIEMISKTINLDECKHYFDGCNTCKVMDNGETACTKMYCEVMEEPRCLDNIEETQMGGTLVEACNIVENTIWLEEFNQCEYLSQETCENIGGTFNECGSACRNDPTAEMCTMQCVSYCQG